MHEHGLGVEQDLVAAYLWYSLAAEGGDDTSAARLGVMSRQLTAAQIAEATARAREFDAPESRDPSDFFATAPTQ